jgi:hypothetical protein
MYKKKAKKMSAKISARSVHHSPTLNTIRMVEDILRNLDLYTIKLSDLKRKLPKKVNHNTLKEVINYLQESGKVYVGVNGITWIYNPSKKLAKAIKNSWELTPEGFRKFRGKVY